MPGEELRVLVVGRPLEQHRADALRDAAAHLAFDDRGVDERTAVLDDDVALDRRRARSRRRRRRSRSACRPTIRLRHRRTPRVASSGSGARAATSASVIALDGDAPHRHLAVDEIEVAGARLEQVGRHVEDALAQRAGGVQRGAARPSSPRGCRRCRSPSARLSLSPTTTRTCSNGTPTSSAAIWANVVSWPWPCGICDGEHRHDAVGLEPHAHLLRAHDAASPAFGAGPGSGLDEGGDAEAEVATLRARRRLPRAERRQIDDLGHPLERLAGRDAGEAATVTIASGASPRVTTLRSRSSSGSMPSSWATMSNSRSRVNTSAAHGPRYAT